LDEEIEDDRSTRKRDHGKLRKQKKMSTDALKHHACEEGKIGWQSPENVGHVDLGF
jgi:hypothetical protein